MKFSQAIIIIGSLLFTSTLCGQSNWERFWEQSNSIKVWVILHPFKAKKALEISENVVKITDSIAKTNILDSDKVGGQVDAFRHAYWMACLQRDIGKNAARSLGVAYERSNYRAFKKGLLEEGVTPDLASKTMDLFNNKVGLKFSKKGDKRSNIGLIYKVINAIQNGDLKKIKKDSLGNYLTCEGEIIPNEKLFNVWNNKKCLIPSNK